jgi:alginate O-acetyltransferase complex protein AlgI
MLFHSLQFLLFLPLALAFYWFVAERVLPRKIILVVASLIFYMAWNPAPVVLLLYLTTVDWVVGRLLDKTDAPGKRKLILGLSIVNNVGLLGLFKYADWITKSVVDAAALYGVTLVYKPLGLILPVGLSFIVFQGMSYTIDIYRRELTPRRSWLDVAVFMTFFPHVVAGPIVRASDFLPQIDKRPTLADGTSARALFRIATGMFKKLVIADFLSANIVDRVFLEPGNYSGVEVITAVFAYTLQIYYDFSAYSDIAIGTAALFGYVLKENFDKPYLSRNLSEFWRRWHMSLASWLRDYLYIPLGGNRFGRARTLINLMITMILGGVWHGADWRFVVWGFVHGIGLALNRMWWWSNGEPKNPSRLGIFISTLATFLVVMEVRIVFRAKDIEHSWLVFMEQFKPVTMASPNVTPTLGLVLAIAVLGHLMPHKLYDAMVKAFAWLPPVVRALMLVGLALFIKEVASFEVQPFIYFKF